MPAYSEHDLTRWAQTLVTEPGGSVEEHHREAARRVVDVLVRERRLRYFPTRPGFQWRDGQLHAVVVEDPREPDTSRPSTSTT